MKTLVIGASENPERYSFKAIGQLVKAGHEVVAIGLKSGRVEGIEIQKGQPILSDIDTITLYIGPVNQPVFYSYFVDLKPRRVIFNPGTENPELFNLLRENKIEVEVACTLVLLATNSY
jgi:predicted CoA-binding protein